MGSIEKAIAKMNSNPELDKRSGGDRRGNKRPTQRPQHLRALPDSTDATPDVDDDMPSAPLPASRPVARPRVINDSRYFKLPQKTLEEEGMITPDAQRNQMSEEYRAIKRRILSAVDNNVETGEAHANVIMVTSCVSGEGKTFSAINLAISIAMERDRSVLLVDADVTNPMSGSRLGFTSEQSGLTDLLLDSTMDPDDLIWESSIDGFQFLPAGKSNNQVTELLSSKNMTALTRDLSRRHPERVIIIDSAPMLMTSEARVVADLAGQIVFVVAANSTTKVMVADALKLVNDHSRVGLILNKSRKSIATTYGYGYGYGTAIKK